MQLESGGTSKTKPDSDRNHANGNDPCRFSESRCDTALFHKTIANYRFLLGRNTVRLGLFLPAIRIYSAFAFQHLPRGMPYLTLLSAPLPASALTT